MHHSSLPLKELRQQYQIDLFDEYLPFVEKHVFDYELGGFLCNTTPQGQRVSNVKRIWYQGRGIWVCSFLYSNFGREQRYLDIAEKTIRLLLKHQPAEGQTWPVEIDRDGQPLGPPDPEIYGDLFIAEGLVGFSKASGDRHYWDLAKEIIRKCVPIYDRPDYSPHAGEHYFGTGAKPFPGVRVLGAWMVFLRLATQMLEIRADREISELADRSIDAILNRHFNPRFRLMNELLQHDLSRPGDRYEQFVYAGHALETCWMVMDEAVRRQDHELFRRAAEQFRRHVDVAWDRVYGGLYCNLQNVDENAWVLDKILFPQQEALAGMLLLAEHSDDPWAPTAFLELNAWAHEKYPLKQHGSPLWQITGNRQVDYMPDTTRIENYHHPRFLMLSLLALGRMLSQSDRVPAAGAPHSA